MSDATNKSDVQDWRLQATSELAEDANLWGKVYPKGTVIKQAVNIKLPNQKTLVLHVPNATALFLNSSHRAFAEASVILKQHKITAGHTPTVMFGSDDEAFTWLENMMTSIVSAYTAVEAFVNQSIPDDFKFEINKAGVIKVFEKSDIERRFPLKEKLSSVLPSALALTNPVGHKGWNKFCRLEGMRDRIIHMKSKDQNVNGDGKGTVWEHLFSFPEPVSLALPLLEYLTSQMEIKRRWVTHRPF